MADILPGLLSLNGFNSWTILFSCINNPPSSPLPVKGKRKKLALRTFVSNADLKIDGLGMLLRPPSAVQVVSGIRPLSHSCDLLSSSCLTLHHTAPGPSLWALGSRMCDFQWHFSTFGEPPGVRQKEGADRPSGRYSSQQLGARALVCIPLDSLL